ncbi:hypothetical protein PR048_026549 [Dryococelus australis]|uniref:Integrase catalytic domain-containing protein n=1 Tax=Dryococelus australis TaxID=614101 RepID=A0ABQ9GLP4_9NEOP|nr:hypothetical protein PR048_026549 [Dryococelus australis]
MGHQNKRHVKEILKRELNLDLPLDGEFCEGCIKGKAHRLKFGRRKREGENGRRYTYSCVWPIHCLEKMISQNFEQYILFKIETKYLAKAGVLDHKVMCIQCDNGGEFNNESLQSFLKTKGIEIRYTMPYIHQQNGWEEREICTILEIARTLMHPGEASLPKEFGQK